MSYLVTPNLLRADEKTKKLINTGVNWLKKSMKAKVTQIKASRPEESLFLVTGKDIPAGRFMLQVENSDKGVTFSIIPHDAGGNSKQGDTLPKE